jgi:hypothetical protein
VWRRRARVASNRLPTVSIYRFVPAPPVCAARARVSRVCPVCVPAPPGVFFTGTLVGWDACEVRLCDSCVRSPCVSGLSPVSFYRYMDTDDLFTG